MRLAGVCAYPLGISLLCSCSFIGCVSLRGLSTSCVYWSIAAYTIWIRSTFACSFQRVSDISTRSMATLQLIVLVIWCSTLGDRAFPVAAARAWNALPYSVSLPTFTRLLKTHLFRRSFYLLFLYFYL